MAITSSTIMLTLLVLMGIATISLSAAAPTSDESYANRKKDNANEHPLPESEQRSFLARNGRFLAPRVQAVGTCNVYPMLCRAKASPGPDCCNKHCVNVMTDKLNCGKCGKKCNYYEMCCQGKCVNPSNDEGHCGRCNNKCSNGGSCKYGLCSYA